MRLPLSHLGAQLAAMGRYGYFVGCNNLGEFPFPTYQIYYDDAKHGAQPSRILDRQQSPNGPRWFTLPGPCSSNTYKDLAGISAIRDDMDNMHQTAGEGRKVHRGSAWWTLRPRLGAVRGGWALLASALEGWTPHRGWRLHVQPGTSWSCVPAFPSVGRSFLHPWHPENHISGVS